jgi:surfeit locus 1 family protein
MTSRARLSFVAFAVAAAAVCLRLGIWQLDRRDERVARNSAELTERDKSPVDLSPDARPLPHRRVRASGRYDFEREIVLRGRAFEGVPGVELVTPLRLPGRDTAVLVHRGFVPSPDAATIDPSVHREAANVQIEGLTLPIPAGSSGGGAPISANGRETWRRLDLAALRSRLPYPVYETYVLIELPAGGGGAPRRIPPPSLDEGPHLNYAIQWFAFAAIALIGSGAFLVTRRKVQ